MEPYIYLDHTADVKFAAYGKTLEEGFANALFAMVNLMTEAEGMIPTIKKRILVSGPDKEALLYRFLEEALFIYETEGFMPCGVEEIRIVLNGKPSLEATLVLDDARKYEIRDYIKAVTYNEMEIKEEGGKWILNVVLDV
ncbi:TPA: hypothetical protein DCX15_05720 [bacterium]|nr:hypothetical protein [bacterium]